MLPKKKTHPPEKAKLHPHNRHRERYNFTQLIAGCPALAQFVKVNAYGDESLDFANPAAVKMLNRALLRHFYDVEEWDIPPNYLCPPIPGRADYIHHIADLLAVHNDGIIPSGKHIKCLDIGIGANCVYPLIGHKEYGWSFIGTDIDAVSLASANRIIAANSFLQGVVECRLQTHSNNIFRGVLQPGELIDLSICNPPFHASLAEAQAGTLRKLSNLQARKVTRPTLNFGGQNRELWCTGGAEAFVGQMIRESRGLGDSCFWFSTLIAKQASLKSVYAALKAARAVAVKTIPMGQGNKISRIVAWTFLSPKHQKDWVVARWRESA
jgi:23S rRNA (adenine1618-N6)-methyltransferase